MRPVLPKALFAFSLMFYSRMHTSSSGRSLARQFLLTRKTYTMPITGSSVRSLTVLQFSVLLKPFADISTADFPGAKLVNGHYGGLRPTPEFHPHLRLEECMVSAPKVNPGDAVFWHCDVVHSVEQEHTGLGDSAGKSEHSYKYCSLTD